MPLAKQSCLGAMYVRVRVYTTHNKADPAYINLVMLYVHSYTRGTCI